MVHVDRDSRTSVCGGDMSYHKARCVHEKTCRESRSVGADGRVVRISESNWILNRIRYRSWLSDYLDGEVSASVSLNRQRVAAYSRRFGVRTQGSNAHQSTVECSMSLQLKGMLFAFLRRAIHAVLWRTLETIHEFLYFSGRSQSGVSNPVPVLW